MMMILDCTLLELEQCAFLVMKPHQSLAGVVEGMLVVMMEVTEVMVMENRSGGGDAGNGNSGSSGCVMRVVNAQMALMMEGVV